MGAGVDFGGFDAEFDSDFGGFDGGFSGMDADFGAMSTASLPPLNSIPMGNDTMSDSFGAGSGFGGRAPPPSAGQAPVFVGSSEGFIPGGNSKLALCCCCCLYLFLVLLLGLNLVHVQLFFLRYLLFMMTLIILNLLFLFL